MDNIGFWNVKGMNRLTKQNEINFFLHNKDIGLIGLIETKINNKAFQKAQLSFYNWCISTNSGYHKGGRIWIVWKPQVYRVQFLEYSAQHIHMKVESIQRSQSFYFTVVYAFNGIQDRVPLWGHLRRISSSVSGPWAIGGDFNCIMSVNEKVGGNVTTEGSDQFRNCIGDCSVIDLHSTSAYYTWNNKQSAGERIHCKLDRFLVNKEWSTHYPDSYAHFLTEGLSDHSPCLVQFSQPPQHKRSFKYYNMWGKSESFDPIVRSEWDKEVYGVPMYQIVTKLKQLKQPLKALNKDKYSDIEVLAAEKEKELEAIQEELGKNPVNISLREEEHRVRQNYSQLKEARDSYLLQKSKQKWSLEGDLNTAYFHGVIRGRMHRTKVIRTNDINGKDCYNPADIQQAFLDYYQSLLGNSQHTTKVHRRVIAYGRSCTEEMGWSKCL
ncbi:hypothetical protein vseg_007472 [Gypsophila vaccaria]